MGWGSGDSLGAMLAPVRARRPHDSRRTPALPAPFYNPCKCLYPPTARSLPWTCGSPRVILFEHALAEASIDRAFQRHVDCDRGVLRICEDLHDLDSYNRVLVISIGKAAHAMVNSLEMQAGNRFEGIVASSVDPLSQVRGFRYFRGGHPLPEPGIDPCCRVRAEVSKCSECGVARDLHAQWWRVIDRREAD